MRQLNLQRPAINMNGSSFAVVMPFNNRSPTSAEAGSDNTSDMNSVSWSTNHRAKIVTSTPGKVVHQRSKSALPVTQNMGGDQSRQISSIKVVIGRPSNQTRGMTYQNSSPAPNSSDSRFFKSVTHYPQTNLKNDSFTTVYVEKQRPNQQPSWMVRPTSDVTMKDAQICQDTTADYSKTFGRKRKRIVVCVRKRPRNRREIVRGDDDILAIPTADHIVVCEPRQRFDLTEYMERTAYRFDHCFDEHVNTAQVYQMTAAPMVGSVFQGYMATCFAYGQTGSGKTFTMAGPKVGENRCPVIEDGIYGMVVADMFNLYENSNYRDKYTISVNFFEIYCNKVNDLLNQKQTLRVMEDAFGSVQLLGLREYMVLDVKTTLSLLRHGYELRTNGQTLANENSSRSHAIFQINIRRRLPEDRRRLISEQQPNQTGYYPISETPCSYPNAHYSGPLVGRFTLVDLAGNERSADSACTMDRARQRESGEINKSLLALKECIRAMGGSHKTSYLPFRTSKLTQVLRESFVGTRSCTCMIAAVSPALSCCEHSMNTLRYAARVKQLTPLAHVSSMPYGTTRTAGDLPRNTTAQPTMMVLADGDDQLRDSRVSRVKADAAWQTIQNGSLAKQRKNPPPTANEQRTPKLFTARPTSKSDSARSQPSYCDKPTTQSCLLSSGRVNAQPRQATSTTGTSSKILSSTCSTGDSQLSIDQLGTDVDVSKITTHQATTGVKKLHPRPNSVKSASASVSERRHSQEHEHRHVLRIQRQKQEVVKKHEAFVNTLPQWIAEHRRLLRTANREKNNMMAYVNLLTSRLSQDIEQLKMIKGKNDAIILRGLQAQSN